jgi:hypothetical protein
MKPKLGPGDPLVQQALSGVYKSSCEKLFFRIEKGVHKKVSVARELACLPISHENRKELIKTFPFALLGYCSELMKTKAAAAAKQSKARLAEADGYDFAADDPVEEEAEDEAINVNSKENKRYSLVTRNNGYYGCYDGRDGDLTLFNTRGEAEDFINDRLRGKSDFKLFYGK